MCGLPRPRLNGSLRSTSFSLTIMPGAAAQKPLALSHEGIGLATVTVFSLTFLAAL